jgi:hypothetical protein
MSDETSEINDLLHRAAAGDQNALAEAFGCFRGRLKRMVQLRLDRRLPPSWRRFVRRSAPGYRII